MAGKADESGGGSHLLDVAFLVGAGPSNTAALLDALREQSLTPGEVTMVQPAGRAAALATALRSRTDRPIAVLDADLVVSSVPLGAVLDDPRLQTAALAEPASGTDLAGGPTSEVELLGVLRVDQSDRARAGDLAMRLQVPEQDAVTDPLLDPLLALTRSLQESGTDVRPVRLTGYVWARPIDETEARSAAAGVAALPERRVRLREAARGGDGFYSTFVLRKLSWRFTDIALRLHLSSNQVTVISLVLGLAAAVCLGTAQRPWMVLGAVLLQLCLIVDCVDGELARFRRRFSRFGAWLDATTDRVKEFAAIGGLAVAADRSGTPVWWLAAIAIGVQTFRHIFELGWALQREYATGGVTVAPPQWRAGQVRLRFKQIAKPAQTFDWLRRLGHFPIGERFLVMSLGAALWTGRGTLYLLAIGSVLAAFYMLGAFAVRARSARAPAARLRAMVERGPVLRFVPLPQAHARRVEALLPAIVAAVELVLLWVLVRTVGDASGPATLGLLASTAIAHYQHVYGVRELAAGRASSTSRPTLGTDGRLLVAVAVAVVAGLTDSSGTATAGAWLLAAVVLLDTVLGSLSDWFGGGAEPAATTSPASGEAPQVPETAGGTR